MTEQKPPAETLYRIERQTITVADFESSGFILDIGGGGEGIIGILKDAQVVAIDPLRSELEEAAPGPLKIIMDARELQFLDASFETVTAFFSFGYMADHPAVLGEIRRVLKPGGKFLFWDVIVPARTDPSKRIYVIPLTVRVKGQAIETGYGIPWRDEAHDTAYYRGVMEQAGFVVEACEEDAHTVHLVLRKG